MRRCRAVAIRNDSTPSYPLPMDLILSIVTLVLLIGFGLGVLSRLSELIAVLRNIDKNIVEAATEAKKGRE